MTFVEGAVQHLIRVAVQPGEHLVVRPRHARGRLLQSFAVRVLAAREQQLAHGLLRTILIEHGSIIADPGSAALLAVLIVTFGPLLRTLIGGRRLVGGTPRLGRLTTR
ncbi:hypothetical protein GCM10027199_13100 [Amycolatopsis magusensis]